MASISTTAAIPDSSPQETGPFDAAQDIRRLGRKLHTLLVESVDEAEATQRFLEYVCQQTGARGGWYFPVTDQGDLSAQPSACTPTGFGGEAVRQLQALTRIAQSEGAIQLARADAQGNGIVFVVPVFRPGLATECFAVVVPVELESNRKLAAVGQLLQLQAAFAGQWRGRFAELRQTTEAVSWQYVCSAIAQAAVSDQVATSAQLMADGLAKLLQARFVAIGWGRSGAVCRVAAVAPCQQFDRDGELGRCLETVLGEAVLEEAASPDESDRVRSCRATDAVQQLRQVMKSDHLWQGPLLEAQGRTFGACIVLFESPPSSRQRRMMSVALSVTGPMLDLVRRNTTRVGTWTRRLRQAYQRRTARSRVALTAAVLAVVLFLFAVPLPYRLSCPCDVQPLTRRYVVAPYEGRLEAAYVEPGDFVSAGQILARMDAADIRLEVAGLEADLQRAKKQRDSSLASRETAAAQISLFEMERLQLRIDLLRERMDNLDIRSPTDGMVISGEPLKLQGARLTMGQTLLEVGPLGDMVLEVAVSDRDAAHARVGAPVRFRLESMPLQTLHGELTRIHPRAEQRDGRNVFVGQVRLLPEQKDLRPGMRGRAKILSGYRPLFWILFHRAWENVLLRVGW